MGIQGRGELPPAEPIGDATPERVSVTDGEKTEDDRNACHDCPKCAGKSCELSKRDEEGDETAEDKAASEAKALLEGVWFRAVVHWCGCILRLEFLEARIAFDTRSAHDNA